jgi:hypothetical protein
MRKLILGTVSVLALGIGGTALDSLADADDAVPSTEGNMPSTPGTSPHWINTANLSKDDVRWAQVELRNLGLYDDSLDGVIGPETIEPVEREDVERHGIAPAYAGFRTTIDPNVLDGGDGQFR